MTDDLTAHVCYNSVSVDVGLITPRKATSAAATLAAQILSTGDGSTGNASPQIQSQSKVRDSIVGESRLRVIRPGAENQTPHFYRTSNGPFTQTHVQPSGQPQTVPPACRSHPGYSDKTQLPFHDRRLNVSGVCIGYRCRFPTSEGLVSLRGL